MNRRTLPWKLLAGASLMVGLAACDGALVEDEGREVPTYSVQNSAVSEAQAETLRASLNIPSEQSLVREDGAIVYLDEDGFQQLPTLTGQAGTDEAEGHQFVSEFFDPGALDAMPPALSDEDAMAQVEAALDDAELHPSLRLQREVGEVDVDTGHSEFQMRAAADGSIEHEFELDTHVSYVPQVRADTGLVDLTGPGASVKAVLDPEGVATLLHYEMYDLEAGGTVTVPTAEEATDQCAETFEGEAGEPDRDPAPQQAETQVTAELVYYAPPFSEAPETVYPYYQCSGTMQVGGEDGPTETVRLRSTLIQATDAAPALTSSGTRQAEREASHSDEVAPQALGQVDVGTEWIGESQGLSGSQGNAGGFDNAFGSRTQFNWGNFNAWERDFKDSVTSNGNDDGWVDNVDAVFYTGHANANSFTFPGTNDDGRLRFPEAGWGQRDLEWLVIAACGPLQRNNGSGTSWHERWGDAFRGLHLMLAYANVSNDNQREGRIYGRALQGNLPFLPALKVRQAWALAATRVQPSDVTYAYMGVADSDFTTNMDDHFWGEGSTGPDIDPGEIAYYWRVSSPS